MKRQEQIIAKQKEIIKDLKKGYPTPTSLTVKRLESEIKAFESSEPEQSPDKVSDDKHEWNAIESEFKAWVKTKWCPTHEQILDWFKARLSDFASLRQHQEEELQKLMDDILEWSGKTFINESSYSKIKHLEREVYELENAIFHEQGKEETEMEFADCFMLLLASSKMEGMTASRLIEVAREKLEINKKRTWGKPDKDGVCQHLSQK
jgi:hypothetical protein